jgi:hypothetical protein
MVTYFGEWYYFILPFIVLYLLLSEHFLKTCAPNLRGSESNEARCVNEFVGF